MFGMGFTEIMVIAVIAILFLGPDKLPQAMVEIAKFFRNTKNTLSTVKDSLEQEMNVSEIKQEALAYKKELEKASEDVKKKTDIKQALFDDDFDVMSEVFEDKPKPTVEQKPVVEQKYETVTFEKKPK
ncbi:MAG: Sec-independent protein translocase subunit TatB [Campylobacterales bacterium]|nr:Sec-independent protein translocase subunit TatB [Campylobacterales bacterium]